MSSIYDNSATSIDSGGFLVTGIRHLTKFDNKLNITWQKELNQNLSNTTEAYEISDGGVLVAGGIVYPDSNQDTQNSMDWILYKLDKYGNAAAIQEIAGSTQNKLAIYPNPVSGILHLKGIGNVHDDLNYTIYDLHGQGIQSGKIENTSATIILKELPSGLYFLSITDLMNNKVASAKFYKE